ncbi:MAG: arsenate reductase family protein [Candidatus Melainabacteria bacterium]|nr:arsenate reductase family protein [Candidatus Melainabacteria bacterium]
MPKAAASSSGTTAASRTTVSHLYWLPYCSTCVKAEQFLIERGVKVQHYTNLKEDAIGRETVAQLAEAVGGVEKLFSKRAMKYRSLGLDKKTLSDDDMLDYMVQEYTFIKRPVVVFEDGLTLAGFSAKQYEAALKPA